MSTTARLNLPYIAPLQAQKQVSYNEAMIVLDQLVQPTVKSRTTLVPPGSPAEGDTYIVAAGATGAWDDHDGEFACWIGGGWRYRTPEEGWLAYVNDAAELAVCEGGGSWTAMVSNGGTTLAKLGINTIADLTNRLALASEASLFTHDGSSHRMAINKAAAGNTASLALEDNFSGRAELGLMGDDAFRVKVSPDGSSWFEALRVTQGSGLVTLPIGQLAFPAVQNPSVNANTLDDYEEGTFTPVLQFGGLSTGITYGSPTLGRYTKIGRMVTVSGSIVLTNKGSATGAASIAGLPFTSANDGVFSSAAIGFASGMSTVTGAVLATIPPNGVRLSLYHSNNGASAGLTNANFGNSSQIFFAGSYDS